MESERQRESAEAKAHGVKSHVSHGIERCTVATDRNFVILIRSSEYNIFYSIQSSETELQDTYDSNSTSFLNEREAKLVHLDRNLEQIIKTLKKGERETRNQRSAMVNDAKKAITPPFVFLPFPNRSLCSRVQ